MDLSVRFESSDVLLFFFFKQKTAYEMRISDWSSDVCSSDLLDEGHFYQHHNLYYVTSDEWELRALRTVLRSSLSVMIIATYCTRMAGGFMRFQAQYLRRLRLQRWERVSEANRARSEESGGGKGGLRRSSYGG